MATYNCFLKEVTVNEWTVEGGGTALEAIGKETVEPTAPSTAKFLNSTTTAKRKAEGKFTVPKLAEGEKVIAATIHVYCKVGSEGKSLKFGFVGPAVFSEPTVTVAAKWLTVSLSKAQAEELTQSKLEELKFLIENVLGKATFDYEVYLSIETTTGGAVSLKGTIAVEIGATGNAGDKQGLGGTIKVVTGSSASATDKQGLGGTVSVQIGSSAKVGDTQGLGGTVKVVIGASGSITTKSGNAVNLSGTISLTIGASAKAGDKQGLAGTIKVVTGASAKAGARQGLGGAIHLTTAAVATPGVRQSLSGVIGVTIGASGSVTATGGRRAYTIYVQVTPPQQAHVAVRQPPQVPHTIQVE